MRASLALFALLVWCTRSFAQQAAPGSKMAELKVASSTQPLLPIWYNLTYAFIVLVAAFFIFVLYRSIKDKTWTH